MRDESTKIAYNRALGKSMVKTLIFTKCFTQNFKKKKHSISIFFMILIVSTNLQFFTPPYFLYLYILYFALIYR